MIHDDDGQRALLVQAGDGVIFELLAGLSFLRTRFTIHSGAPPSRRFLRRADACYGGS